MILPSAITDLGARAARFAAVELGAWLLILFLVCLSLGFAALALYLALLPPLGGAGAALIVSGLALLIGLAIALTLVLRHGRKPASTSRKNTAASASPETLPAIALGGFLAGLLTGK